MQPQAQSRVKSRKNPHVQAEVMLHNQIIYKADPNALGCALGALLRLVLGRQAA